jgi:hypothetical protein
MEGRAWQRKTAHVVVGRREEEGRERKREREREEQEHPC